MPLTEVDESVRTRKKRATRELVRQRATTLVGERGLGAVTVEEIAAAAGVSTRTFFNYFPTKEDAIVGWDPGQLAELTECLRSRPSVESPLLALRAALIAALRPFDGDYRDLLERLRVARADPNLLAHQVRRFGDMERLLVASLAERRGTDAAHDYYASLVVAAVLSAARTAAMAWCDQEGRIPLAQVLGEHLDLLGAGLRAPERGSR